jgi:hypothetical protein
MSLEQNMSLWARLCTTDPSYTQPVKRGGFSFTAIDAMYQVRRMTETFGSIGRGWGYTIDERWRDDYADGTSVANAMVTVWYGPSADNHSLAGPHCGCCELRVLRKGKDGREGYWQTDPEAWKKAITNALTKCFSLIGLCADVFEGMFDDSRYVDELRRAAKQGRVDLVPEAPAPAPAPAQDTAPPARANNTQSHRRLVGAISEVLKSGMNVRMLASRMNDKAGCVVMDAEGALQREALSDDVVGRLRANWKVIAGP